MKATLVLLPLLGITYMLFFVNPGEDEISQIVFIYFNSFLESFQVRLCSSVLNRRAKLSSLTRSLLFLAGLLRLGVLLLPEQRGKRSAPPPARLALLLL